MIGMYHITFKFEQKGLETIIVEDAPEGDSILEVALNNNIYLHHNCGGVCACSTCHIYIDAGEGEIEEITDREEDFIDRARNPRLNSRLGCQCILQENGGNVLVTIPDQTLIHGE
jgi:2Fe-2S ferredoxin